MSDSPIHMMVLPCKLTDDELAERRDRMARVLKERDDIEGTTKAAVSEAREKVKALDAELRVAAEQVRSRTEYRTVRIVENRNDDKKTMVTVRTDSGEVVSTRPMTDEERQVELFPADKKRRPQVVP